MSDVLAPVRPLLGTSLAPLFTVSVDRETDVVDGAETTVTTFTPQRCPPLGVFQLFAVPGCTEAARIIERQHIALGTFATAEEALDAIADTVAGLLNEWSLAVQ